MYGTCEIKEKNSYALIPFYGHFHCKGVDDPEFIDGTWARIGDADLLGYYNYEGAMSCPSASRLVKRCEFRATNNEIGIVQNIDLKFRVCDSANDCGDEQTIHLQGGQDDYVREVSAGQWVKFYFHDSPGASHNNIRIYEKHVYYSLFQVERGREPELINDNGCIIPADKRSQLCINCEDPKPGDNENIHNNPVNSLEPEQYSSYLKDWVMSPLKANFIEDFDGEIVDCSHQTVYSLTTIDINDGNCYAYPFAVKRDVTCCPGETMPGKYCSDEFEWIIGDQGCVRNGIPSILHCDGQGKWSHEIGTTYKKATSCNQDGTCTYEVLDVPCAYPDIGCAEGYGYYCDVNPENPMLNKCEKGGGPVCPNDICEPGENIINCPEDCDEDDPIIIPLNLVVPAFLGIVGFGIAHSMIKKKKNKMVISILVGLIIAIGLYYIFTYYYDLNQILVGFGNG
jgi:hypothetical protein